MIFATVAVFIALVLVIGLAGCGQAIPPPQGGAQETRPEQITVCIDQDFSPADQAKAHAACGAWTYALRGVAELTPRSVDFLLPVHDCDVQIFAVTSTMPLFAWEPSTHLGYTQGNTISVLVDRRPDLRRGVFTHELGHAIGLSHTMGGLMSPEHRHGGAQVSDTDAVWAAYFIGRNKETAR